MIGFAQLADWFIKQGLNKTVAAISAYLILIFVLGFLVFLVAPPLIGQLRSFVEQLPSLVSRFNYLFNNSSIPGIKNEDIGNLISNQINPILSNSINLVFDTVNVILSFITIAVFSFYMLLERETLKSNLFRVFPNLPKERVNSLAREIEKQLGGWLKGELLLMCIIFLATYIGLTLLKVDYALPLAIIAGLLEAVPIIGPILASIPAVVITFTVSPLASLGVALLYLLIQQVENSLLVPKVMQGVIGINPILILITLLVGAEIFGVAGAIISVPMAAVIQVIIFDIAKHQDFK
jgi:predicted PurR-regulated permease PerM